MIKNMSYKNINKLSGITRKFFGVFEKVLGGTK